VWTWLKLSRDSLNCVIHCRVPSAIERKKIMVSNRSLKYAWTISPALPRGHGSAIHNHTYIYPKWQLMRGGCGDLPTVQTVPVPMEVVPEIVVRMLTCCTCCSRVNLHITPGNLRFVFRKIIFDRSWVGPR
jgi:hypothetical protein